MHDTWAARDLPVLDATIELLEQSFMVTVTDIAARTGLSPSVVAAALEVLDPVYVDFRKTTTGGDPRYWYVFKVTPEARRAVGQWPTAESLASRLAEELAAAARDEPDAQRRGLLTYAARLIGETLRDATVRAAGHVLAPPFGGLPVPERGMPVPEPEPVSEDDYPSLVDLPELPELLRTRPAGARTSAAAGSDEPGGAEPAVPESELLALLPEPDEASGGLPAVAEPELFARFPEPDEPTGGQPEVLGPELLAPLPESDEPTGWYPAVPEAQLLAPLPEPDEPTGGLPAVPEPEPLVPLPEPELLASPREPGSSRAADGAAALFEARALPPEPDEVTAP